jgi:carboxyl-terminal processing protease
VYVAVSDVRVDGMRLEGVGVRPDVEVGFDRRWAGGVDPQIERAVDVAGGIR